MKIELLCNEAKPPRTPKSGDAGHDLFSCTSVLIPSLGRAVVNTGVALEIPEGVVGLIWPRSGYANDFGLDVLAGVVDSSYRGEIKVILFNSGDKDVYLEEGCKIAQIIFQPYLTFEFETVQSLCKTDRGSSGFGSTGK